MSAQPIDVIIVGAGAAGLMAARELAKAGKKVIVLEGRDRIGGRIFTLDEAVFGFPVQAGAEFVHGPAPVTKALLAEAGLTYEVAVGEFWNMRDGELTLDEALVPNQKELNAKLLELREDMPIASFLTTYFSDEKYSAMRNAVIKMVEGYDAADPQKISSLALREEWLGDEEWVQGRVLEPVQDRLYFAGEALYSGKETATVEGALASGVQAAAMILK